MLIQEGQRLAAHAADAVSGGPGESIEAGLAWSGFPVGFSLLTAGQWQYVAYYDGDRRMTVASRLLRSESWKRIHLPERLGWDSHNGIAMALDSAGFLHVIGNMHSSPLVYFRSRVPEAIETLERVTAMTGTAETMVTYPQFFRSPSDQLCFGYRHGSSGQGDQVYNVYDVRTRTWRRLNSGVFVSGEGKRNAYLDGPIMGPDGWFHLCWVWRDTPDCATNHDVSYARSRDLSNWETSAGAASPLPVTYADCERVDPVPVGRGLLNGNTKLGFDAAGRVLISYHKLDASGHTQIFIARRELAGWKTYQITNWNWRWLPAGCGSISYKIGVSSPHADAKGNIVQTYFRTGQGTRSLVLDRQTLGCIDEIEVRQLHLDLWSVSGEEKMQVNWSSDRGGRDGDRPPFILRWESLPPNHDQPLTGSIPEPAVLKVIQLSDEDRNLFSR